MIACDNEGGCPYEWVSISIIQHTFLFNNLKSSICHALVWNSHCLKSGTVLNASPKWLEPLSTAKEEKSNTLLDLIWNGMDGLL